MFNHWPLVLITVAFFILLIGDLKLLMPYKSLGLTLLVIAALVTIPTQFSGEGAEHILKDIGAAEHTIIEKHETLGFFSSILTYALGILSFISLIMIHNTHAFFGHMRKFIVLLAGVGILLMAITAHSGGEVRHTEIRTDQVEQ
ncbi:MAG: hypothetical protein GY751_03415 [Bacteroidetes bacterium]|nr:hypothetical protein [Bacteroidota bacterium]